MKDTDIPLLPGELEDCYFHCGYCKKRNLYQDFEDDKLFEFYKCPSCGRVIRNIYANKEEKLINKPVMERNRNAFIQRWKTDSEFREMYQCIKIKEL